MSAESRRNAELVELTRHGFQIRNPDGSLPGQVWSQRHRAEAAAQYVAEGVPIPDRLKPDRVI